MGLAAANPNPDVGRNTPELIASRGFPVETHKIRTDDDYILTAYRIPSSTPGAVPVILNHGLLDSGHTWVSNFRNQSLAYLLADAGYDVWVTNNRGNTDSFAHAKLDLDAACLPCVEVLGINTCPFCDKRKYWEFDFDHMAGLHLQFSNFPALSPFFTKNPCPLSPSPSLIVPSGSFRLSCQHSARQVCD